MSEKMTTINLRQKSKSSGYADYGEKSFEYMVSEIRTIAKRDLEAAQEILNARDEDFEVNLVRGKIIQHHIRKILPKEQMSGKNMEKLIHGFIIDENSNVIEIRDGAATICDDYLYQIDTEKGDGKIVYRSGQDGYINGEFDLHKSEEDLRKILTGN